MTRWRLLAVAILIALVVGLYRAKTEADAARVRVEALEAQLAAEQEAVRLLETQAARLSAPDRMEGLAAERLGLRPAAPDQHIRVEDLDRVAPVETAP